MVVMHNAGISETRMRAGSNVKLTVDHRKYLPYPPDGLNGQRHGICDGDI